MAILKETISLDNGMEVKIHLFPMPQKVKGRYPLLIDGNFPNVSFSFYYKNEFLRKLSWDYILMRNSSLVGLKRQHVLTVDDIDELFEITWPTLINYGLYPTELVLRN